MLPGTTLDAAPGRALDAAPGRALVAPSVAAALTPSVAAVLAASPAAAVPACPAAAAPPDKALPNPAPPNAPIPAIRPFFQSPVTKPVPPPTIKAASGAPTPVIARSPPATIGRMESSQPASYNPVCGLIVNEPPCALAKASNPPTSRGVMCTSMVSLPRPWDCTY